ncbi:CBS domain-containing protein [Gimesia chilikensis]|uniref:CBS domain-containing protein n=1 Tax=Gimesia chilikensis TaxID=2605989 RepID=UPI0011EF5742|nr:CBS domain-containing protein [Gimesia chilikensis]KAA0141406.1 CBS domain-containing protein [Gimesia chilikensis]
MTAGRICTREVDLVDQNESVQVAAERMNSRNVGTLIVLDEESHPIGMLTDRDLALRVVGKGRDAIETTIADIMTRFPCSISEETSIEAALTKMRSGGFRRLPVVDQEGKLIGVLTLDDILELLCEEFTEIGKLIQKESPASLAQL